MRMRKLLAAVLAVACRSPAATPSSPSPAPAPQADKSVPISQTDAQARQARSFNFREERPLQTLGNGEVPISLTASDGSGLELVALKANAVVEDPLAFTELRMT